MKAIFLTLLLFSIVNAQNIWYVNRDATGTNDGRSWENAWKYFDSTSYPTSEQLKGINWNIISPGDTIYISGGTDSTTYTPEIVYGLSILTDQPFGRTYTFASGDPVILTPGWETGHNGDVYFATSADNQQSVAKIKNISNIKFDGKRQYGITFYNKQNPLVTGGNVIEIGSGYNTDSLITFENCRFVTDGAGGVVGINSTKATIRNCLIETMQNSHSNDQDLLGGSGASGSKGGHIIDNCKLIYRNSYEAILDTNLTDAQGMTVTSTSLTDTDLNMTTDYHIQNSVSVGLYYLQITGNNNNTFYGNEWVFEGWTQYDPIATIYTPTSLQDDNAPSGIPANLLIGCILRAVTGDTLVITSNGDRIYYGTGGWQPNTPPNQTGYSITSDIYPQSGMSWVMGGAHRDMVQLSGLGDPTPGTWTTNIFSNNLLIDDSETGTGWNAMTYFVAPFNSRLLFYNNIVVQRKINTNSTAFWIRDDAASSSSFQSGVFLNNTVIIKGKGTTAFQMSIDTLISKNNLIVIDTTTVSNSSNFYSTRTLKNGLWKDINYNYYAKLDGADVGYFATNGPALTYSEWLNQGYGYDVNSYAVNSISVSFANKYGLNREDYYTTSGRDLGIDLSATYPFLAYDALGNERTGAWDIGALEFVGFQSNNINVNGKVFLQGPFNTNAMNTNLSQNALLPNTQPFNTSPWNYNGSESLSSGSSSSYVDWVLVELRNSSNPTQVVARRAAILKNDGTLLNTDGSMGVPFNNIQEGSYYIAVFHRNHLAIMSANPVQLSANSPVYDFTNSLTSAYGQNAMEEITTGVFGMFAGDGNGDGGITIADHNDIWLPQNGSFGYLKGDFNLDCGVTIHDVNIYWNPNNGRMTQVP